VGSALAGAPLLSQMSIATAMLARERSGLVTAPVTDTDGGVVQPATSLEDALRTAFASADVIFVGEVLAVNRTASAVMVRWRVEDAVRGLSAVGLYEQKEWPGLWADGNARYVVGERALVLLHAPSEAGFASPVGDGVIPLRGDTITGTLDLRWIAQQVVVADAARLQPMLALRSASGNFAIRDALLAHTAQTASVPRGLQSLPRMDNSFLILTPPTVGATDDANAHVDGAMILGMLHAWQRAGTAAR
jgi:hypothetical protein